MLHDFIYKQIIENIKSLIPKLKLPLISVPFMALVPCRVGRTMAIVVINIIAIATTQINFVLPEKLIELELSAFAPAFE